MTRTERQQLIDRYTSGAMSPAEQRAFRAALSGDPELRTLLRAEEAIASATRAERAVLAAEATVPGAQLTSLLAASRMAPVSASTLGIGAKLVLLATGAGLIIFGAIAYLPLLLSDSESLDVGSRIPVTRVAPASPAPNPAVATDGAGVTAGNRAAATEQRSGTRTAPVRRKAQTTKAPAGSQAPSFTPAVEQERTAPEQAVTQERPEPPVFENNEVQVEVDSK